MKRGLLALTLAAMGAAAPVASAADCAAVFARKKITLVVPFKPGGGYDAYARMLAPILQEHTGARASVANMPGANGTLGVRAVAAAPADSLTLGVFDLRDLITARLTDTTLPDPADFAVLGSVGTTQGVWAGREAGVSLDGTGAIIAGLSSGIVPRVLLPAMLLERQVTIVRGFSGMSDRWLALLRGDVDIVDGSHDTIARLVAGAPGSKSLLVLAPAPHAVFPGTPHLAGPDGLVAQRGRQLDPASQRSRLELASLAAELSASERTITVAQKAPAAVRACLELAVERALHSEELRTAAAKQKQALEPTRAAVVREQLNRIEGSVARNLPLLKRLAANAAGGS